MDSRSADTDRLHRAFGVLREQLSEAIVGQAALIERLLIALLADGHLLVEGAPGLAKTSAIRALASDPRRELVVFGRGGSRQLGWLERNVRCRVRFLAEERGLRASSPLAIRGEPSVPPAIVLQSPQSQGLSAQPVAAAVWGIAMPPAEQRWGRLSWSVLTLR